MAPEKTLAPPEAIPIPERAARLPIGAIGALLGALAVMASGLLDWTSTNLGGRGASEISVAFLFDPTRVSGGVSLGVGLLGLGTAGALVAIASVLYPWLRVFRGPIGVVALAAPVVFAVRISQVLALPELADVDVGLFDALAAGVYLAAVGALPLIASGKWSPNKERADEDASHM